MNNRPTSSYVIAIASLVLAGLAMVQAIWFDQQNGVKTGSIVLFLLGLIWTYYVFPKVELQPDKVIITNPLTNSEIGFGAIEDVDTRFALKLVGDRKAVSAWAAPAPGRHRHRSASPEDFKFLGLRSGESVRPGDLPSSITGSLAYQIRRAIEEGKTDNRSWSTKPNWLGVASVVIPLVVLVATHI
jgi:hypothetical protein